MEVGISTSQTSPSQSSLFTEQRSNSTQLRFIDGILYDYSEMEFEDINTSECAVEDKDNNEANEENTAIMPEDLLQKLQEESSEDLKYEPESEPEIDINLDELEAAPTPAEATPPAPAPTEAPSPTPTEAPTPAEADLHESVCPSKDPLVQKLEDEIALIRRLLIHEENETYLNICSLEAGIEKMEFSLREARTIKPSKLIISNESGKQKYILAVIHKLCDLRKALEAMQQRKKAVKPVEVEWRKKSGIHAVVEQTSGNVNEIMALVSKKEAIKADLTHTKHLNKLMAAKLEGLIKAVSGLSANIDRSLDNQALKTPEAIMQSTRGLITGTLTRFATQLPTHYNPRVKALLE